MSSNDAASSTSAGRESLERLIAIIDHLPAMVAYWNRDLRNEIANAAYVEWFGFAPAEMVGVHAREVLGADLYAANLPYIESALAGQAQRFESTLTDARGVRRHAQVAYTPDVVDGAVRGFFVLVSDITARVEAERAVARSSDEYRSLIRSIPGGFVLLFDRALRYRVADGDALAAFGFDGAELEGRIMSEVLAPEIVAELEPRYLDALRGVSTSWDRHLGDRVFRLTAGPVRDADGEVFTGTVVCYEVTAERRSQAFARALNVITTLVATKAAVSEVVQAVAEQLRELFVLEQSAVVRFVGEDQVEFLAMSPAMATLPFTVTASPDDAGAVTVVRRTGAPAIRTFPDDPERITPALRDLGLRAGSGAPIRVHGALWGAIALASRDPARLDGSVLARLASFADLVSLAVENAEAWDTLTRHALSDPVTGLANHRAYHEELARELERRRRHLRPLSVVMIDIDRFKQVNDTFGHQAGDRALKDVAERVLAVTRAGELLARIGGEEFAWLLPETDSEEAFRAAERARSAVAQTMFPEVGRLTVSAGVATLRSGDGADLMPAADGALYRAKAGGRNMTCTNVLPAA